MRTATTVEASGGEHWSQQADFVVEAEKLGLDVCWVAEAWGSDAPSALGCYAARTGGPMKYMLLVCGDDTADASGMAPVEPWVEELCDHGVRLHGHRPALPADAATVRVRGGEVLRTDGPFAETKE